MPKLTVFKGYDPTSESPLSSSPRTPFPSVSSYSDLESRTRPHMCVLLYSILIPPRNFAVFDSSFTRTSELSKP